ncbi:hypothetical protein QYE76_036886 [Lolium multiflorum]|uniref:Transposase (putative) gypsy type domain-containing protein n=1 Tax=Lolium multiflorum TaxID=4521 RepID=A0AAD8R5R4_LOLMU|nr:hypothetical protein QYE76_036886 [Lolium multiflorum]
MASEEQELEFSGEPEVARDQEDAGELEVTGEQEAGPSSMAYSRGRWEGSDVSQAEIDWLYQSRRIPKSVESRIPGDEREPDVKPGEVVVFTAHFMRGLGLPVSDFFRRFLNFYELQPRHLPGNAVFYLSSFLAFCEGHVCLRPTVEAFARLYNLRINSIQDPELPLPKPIVQCGACIITPRQKSAYLKLFGLESCRKWQQTFFYVKNFGTTDLINLPAYVPALHKHNEITADDIVRTFITRRVLPLQRRVHKICQMSGRLDPTWISTFKLSKADVVAKAKLISRTKMPIDWEWGLKPLNRKHPPAAQNFSRWRREEPASFTADRTEEDKEDPTSIQNTPVHEMDATHNTGSGKPSAPSSSRTRADDTGSEEDDCVILEVYDPIPVSYAFPAMPVSADLDRQERPWQDPASSPEHRKPRDNAEEEEEAPLLVPSPAKDKRRTSRASPAHSGAGKTPSPSRGPTTSEGNTAPRTEDHRDEGDFTSPPEPEENPGTSNMGVGTDHTARSEPFVVPPVADKAPEAPPVSPNKVSSFAPPEGSKPASPAKGSPAPPPVSSKNKPPTAPAAKKLSSRKSTAITSEQLSGALQATMAQPTGSRALTLHTSRAAASISDKISAQDGRIIELNRGEATLGSLQRYADEWNISDITEGVLESHKKLFEQLLWEHRGLSDAHAALQLTHSQCRAALPESSQLDELVSRVAVLQGEKEKLSLQHQNELQAQKNETTRLKEELIQLGLHHDSALKEAVHAGKAEVEEAKAALVELHKQEVQDRLFKDIDEEKNLRELERQRNNQLKLVQISYGKIIKDLDDKIRTVFPESQARAEAAVAKTRVEDPSSDAAPWTTEEHVTALSARVTRMTKLAKLPDAAIQAFKCLWPGETVPDRIDVLCARLNECGARLHEWLCSATRSGADTALRFVCSWYEDLDLDALATLRFGAPTDTDLVLTAKRYERAYQVAHYASMSTFIPATEDFEDAQSDDEVEETAEDATANDEPAASGQAPESSSPEYA